MKYAEVVFKGSPNKVYTYKVKGIHLPTLWVDQEYRIRSTARSYANPVILKAIHRDESRVPQGVKFLTVEEWIPVNNPRLDDQIQQVYFNETKGTTVVAWKDGTKTKVKVQEGDTFDAEKGIALCYMKKVFKNRGSFNEVFRKYLPVLEGSKSPCRNKPNW